jgi:hypothetical protein
MEEETRGKFGGVGMEITKVGDAFKVVSAIRDAGSPRRRVRKDRHDSIHRGRHPRALRHRDPARCCIKARDGRALDTVPAFGSMWAADYPGMSSMGKMMALALVCTMAAAVLFQPGLGRPWQIKPFPNTRKHLPQAAENWTARRGHSESETLSIWSAHECSLPDPRPFIQFFLRHFGEQMPLDNRIAT